MSKRRFTEKPTLNPGAVISLGNDNAAMRENRTIFPSTVVPVTEKEPDRLLVPGESNRKIGMTVEKGRFKGYGIYMLTLEERATCPSDCSARGYCYGNGMQFARRHKIADSETFFDRLGFEIVELLDAHPGLLIRLHVLGDFPSVEYVAFWKDVLDEYPNVACFGYTHRRTTTLNGDEIGDAIAAVKEAHADRFRIRWSSDDPQPDGAVVLDAYPDDRFGGAGQVVCPAQTDATACCATCGLCWDMPASCIGFIKHGRKSVAAEVETARREQIAGDYRSIRSIPIADLVPGAMTSQRPRFIDVDPARLTVETKYQRDLSVKSLKLIKRIVERFDWTKFKPPVCVEDGDKYYVIDGQHTAIGAASHPDIETIPVMVVAADSVAARAASFVAHNRDRVAMSPYQVFHGEVAAGDPDAVDIVRLVEEVGGTIPRYPPPRGVYKVGQVSAIAEIRAIYRRGGADHLKSVVSIVVEGRCRPVSQTLLRGIGKLLTESHFDDVSRDDIVTALMARPDIESAARRLATETNQGRDNAAAVIIYRAAKSLSTGRAA